MNVDMLDNCGARDVQPAPARPLMESSMSNSQPSKAGKFNRKRSKIVVTATAILNERGVKGMTLGAVATALDMVPPGVTYYFVEEASDLFARPLFTGLYQA
jgi:AcrR family transcriptional regulator